MAAVMTLGITVSLSLYACTTKRDFTMLGGSLFIWGMALLLTSCFLFYVSEFLYVLCCAGTVILYGYYLIYDTQLIMGGKH